MDAQHLDVSIYDDINNFFRYLKQMGVSGADITESSLKRIQKWGKPKIKASVPISPPSSLSSRKIINQSDRPYDRLTEVLKSVKACTKCPLHQTRNQVVFGAGDIKTRIVFVGEAPGYEEDQTGKPFLGAAGQLLTRIIHAMHLNRDMVYICNVLKCCPPEDRKPEPKELEQCFSYLEQQIEIIQPEFICALGTTASQMLLKEKTPISKLRGMFHLYKGIRVMPTYHPSYLLRNESKKRDVWQDMQMIMREMQRVR
ncbi:MAG: uracil-DNA glycosylase [Candidatus Magnetomorum sp.]|nr:uracil-DNA glycosylase [Candidatus Magnetomorum sp.]